MKASDIAIGDVVAIAASRYDRPIRGVVVGIVAKGAKLLDIREHWSERAEALGATRGLHTHRVRIESWTGILAEGHTVVEVDRQGFPLRLVPNRHIKRSWAEQEAINQAALDEAKARDNAREAAWVKYLVHREAIAEAARAKGFTVLDSYEQRTSDEPFLRLPTREEFPNRSAPRELHIEPKVLAALLGRS